MAAVMLVLQALAAMLLAYSAFVVGGEAAMDMKYSSPPRPLNYIPPAPYFVHGRPHHLPKFTANHHRYSHPSPYGASASPRPSISPPQSSNHVVSPPATSPASADVPLMSPPISAAVPSFSTTPSPTAASPALSPSTVAPAHNLNSLQPTSTPSTDHFVASTPTPATSPSTPHHGQYETPAPTPSVSRTEESYLPPTASATPVQSPELSPSYTISAPPTSSLPPAPIATPVQSPVLSSPPQTPDPNLPSPTSSLSPSATSTLSPGYNAAPATAPEENAPTPIDYAQHNYAPAPSQAPSYPRPHRKISPSRGASCPPPEPKHGW